MRNHGIYVAFALSVVGVWTMASTAAFAGPPYATPSFVSPTKTTKGGTKPGSSPPSAAGDDPCDQDGDGAPANRPECWGTGSGKSKIDCDDLDPTRYPGNIEVCEPGGNPFEKKGRDEDCNLETFGVKDNDGDGYVDYRCCNEGHCGNDCDDEKAGVHPNQNEVCNGLDDNCDDAADEGLTITLYEDKDGDMFGGSLVTKRGCFQDLAKGYAFRSGDCDDNDASRTPVSGCETKAPPPKPQPRKRRRFKKR